VAGHTAVALKKAKLPETLVNEIRDQRPLSDPRLDAVAVFTRAVIATRGAVSDAELAAFKAAGFNDAAALEVILGVSLATLCNFANNLAQNELNPQLAAYRWEPKAAA
ncbi:MAG: carboxymuconolactone decarboxylase family protein, partial [Gallionellaceae bacterium]|nr:carboxymuconolactone decarboxylase family protein [Gallionellaceae bacterium]